VFLVTVNVYLDITFARHYILGGVLAD